MQSREQKRGRFLELQYKIKELKSDISKKESINDICPTCGQKIIGVVKPDTSKEKEELANLEIEYSQIAKYLDDLEKDHDNKYRDLVKQKNEDANKIEKENDLIKKDLKTYTNSADKINKDLLSLDKDISTARNDLLLLESTKNQINEDIINLTREISNIDSDLLYINNNKDNLKSHIEVINKMETSIKRDFRGYLLSNIIAYIDKECKDYALDVFNNSNIEFKLDGNNISISYNSKEYENLSGGERQKVDLIV